MIRTSCTNVVIRCSGCDASIKPWPISPPRPRFRPLDVHFRAYRGVCLYFLKRYAPALDQLEAAFQSDPETVHSIATLQRKLNDLAWMLATGPSAEPPPCAGDKGGGVLRRARAGGTVYPQHPGRLPLPYRKVRQRDHNVGEKS